MRGAWSTRISSATQIESAVCGVDCVQMSKMQTQPPDGFALEARVERRLCIEKPQYACQLVLEVCIQAAAQVPGSQEEVDQFAHGQWPDRCPGPAFGQGVAFLFVDHPVGNALANRSGIYTDYIRRGRLDPHPGDLQFTGFVNGQVLAAHVVRGVHASDDRTQFVVERRGEQGVRHGVDFTCSQCGAHQLALTMAFDMGKQLGFLVVSGK